MHVADVVSQYKKLYESNQGGKGLNFFPVLFKVVKNLIEKKDSVDENHVIKDVTITSVSKGANEIIVKGNMSVTTMIKL